MSCPKPNFFIVGAPKCGTTAVAHYLSEHPNVFFCKPKEPFFWSNDIPFSRHEMVPRSMTAYLGLFKDVDPVQHKIIGEGSTRYLRSSVAIPRILEFNPEAKFLAILRNPVEVAQAYHMEQQYVFHEDEPNFEKAWRLQEQRARGECLPKTCASGGYVQYGWIASFAPQVKRMIDCVPKSQRKVVIFDDFKSSPKTVYEEILKFLDIPPDGRVDFPPVNSSHRHRYPVISKAILYPPKPFAPIFRAIRRFLMKRPSATITAAKQHLNERSSRSKISIEMEHELKNYFRRDVEELSALLGRDLTDWCKI